MRKLLALIILLLFIPIPTHAAGKAIYVTSAPNRNYQGEITNKNFENSLAPDGLLGKVIFQAAARPRTWVIDAALVEDVQSLAAKNSTNAQNWLTKLNQVTRGDSVYATAYGNPDVVYLKSLAPSELNFYYQVGQQRLELVLKRNLYSEQGSGFAYQRTNISADVREFFNNSRSDFSLLSTIVNPKEIELDRARIAQLFSPLLSNEARIVLLNNFQTGQNAVINKLRIVSGRYHITNSTQKMPITLVNDFESPVKVDLLFTPLNNRVVFPQYRQITLNAKSKMQVSVPVKTIAAGETTVVARFENGKGKIVGANGILELTSTIISPAVSLFTTGAGVLLILAAVAQSVRRVRRNRKQ